MLKKLFIIFCLFSGYSVFSDINKDLLDAALSGNIEKVNLALSKGADLNTRGESNNTALMIASQKGNIEIVKFLIDKKASINAENYYRQTPLILASQRGHIEIIKLLISKGAYVDERALLEVVQLERASESELIGMIRLFIEKAPYITANNTALIKAVRSGRTEIVKLLIEKGADVNASDVVGNTALIEASLSGNMEIVKSLIEKGVNVDAKDKEGNTALMNFLHKGNSRIELIERNIYMEIARMLIEKTKDINAKFTVGETALMRTSRSEYPDIVRLLIEKGADVNAKDKYGNTTLMEASLSGNMEIVKVLVEKGADVNAKNNNGNTALSCALHYDSFKDMNKEIVDFLIESGSKYMIKINKSEKVKIKNINKNEKIPIVVDSFFKSISLSRDGKYIAVLRMDEETDVYDFFSGKLLKTITLFSDKKEYGYQHRLRPIPSFSISSENKYIIYGIENDSIKIVKFDTAKIIKSLDSKVIKCLEMTPDDKYIITGNSNGAIDIWDFKSGKIVYTFTSHSSQVREVMTGGKGKYLISRDEKHQVMIWDIESRKLIKNIDTAKSIIDSTMTLTPDEEYLLLNKDGEDFQMKIYEIKTGALINKFSTPSLSRKVSISISSDKKYIITADKEDVIEIFEYATGKLINKINEKNISRTSRSIDEKILIKTIKDGNYIITTYDNKIIKFRTMNELLNFIDEKNNYKVPDDYKHIEKYLTNKIEPKIDKIPDNIQKNVFLNPKEYMLELIDYLVKDENDEFIKVKHISDWIFSNIKYDYESVWKSEISSITKIEDILKEKKGVCGHIAYLFYNMCKLAGIEAKFISGWGESVGGIPHAWNAVKIEDYWYLLDITWNINKHNPTAFLFRDPKLFIKDHFPFASCYQFLKEPVSLEAFKTGKY